MLSLLLATGTATSMASPAKVKTAESTLTEVISETAPTQDQTQISPVLIQEFKNKQNKIVERKAMMEVYKRSDDKSYNQYYYQQLPSYAQEFKEFLDFVDQKHLWPQIKNPWYFKIENTKLENVRDMTPMKDNTIAYFEQTIAEMDAVYQKISDKKPVTKREQFITGHNYDYGELNYALASILTLKGETENALAACQKGLMKVQSKKLPLLEQSIRIKMANLLDGMGRYDKAESALQYVYSIDASKYSSYDFNYNMTRAHETLGNVADHKGDQDAAIQSYQSALKFTSPDKSSWGSIMMNVATLHAKSSNIRDMKQTLREIEVKNNNQLITAMLLSGNALYNTGDFDNASDMFLQAFNKIKEDPRDKTEAITNLIRSYREMGREDFILDVMKTAKEDPVVRKNDEVMYTYSKVLVDIGTDMRLKLMPSADYERYFKEAENLLQSRAFGKDLIKDRYATKSILLLTQLYMNKDDLRRAESCVTSLISSNTATLEEYRQSFPNAKYTADLVAQGLKFWGDILVARNKQSSAVTQYMEVIKDFSVARDGQLKTHQDAAALDSCIIGVTNVGHQYRLDAKRQKGYQREGTLERALDIFDDLRSEKNLSTAYQDATDFNIGHVHFEFGTEKHYEEAIRKFKVLREKDPVSRQKDKATVMEGMCWFELRDEKRAIDLWQRVLSKGEHQEELYTFMAAEDRLPRIFSATKELYRKGDRLKAISMYEGLLNIIDGHIDTQYDALLAYEVAKSYIMLNDEEMGKDQRYTNAEKYLDKFFESKYSTLNQILLLNAEDLKFDIAWAKGLVTRYELEKQITKTEHLKPSDMEQKLAKLHYRMGLLFNQDKTLDTESGRSKWYLDNALDSWQESVKNVVKAVNKMSELEFDYDEIKYNLEYFGSNSLYETALAYMELGNLKNALNKGFKPLFIDYPKTEVAGVGFDRVYKETTSSDGKVLGRWIDLLTEVYNFVPAERADWKAEVRDALLTITDNKLMTENKSTLEAIEDACDFMTEQALATQMLPDSMRVINDSHKDKALIFRGDIVLRQGDLKNKSAYMKKGLALFPNKNAGKAEKFYNQVIINPESSVYGVALAKMIRLQFLDGDYAESRKTSFTKEMKEIQKYNSTREARTEREVYTVLTYIATFDQKTAQDKMQNYLQYAYDLGLKFDVLDKTLYVAKEMQYLDSPNAKKGKYGKVSKYLLNGPLRNETSKAKDAPIVYYVQTRIIDPFEKINHN